MWVAIINFARRSLVYGVTLVLVLGGCTSHDVFFGNGLVPPSQQMNTFIDSSMTVRTSTIVLDSIATSNTAGVLFLGSVHSPLVGTTTSQAITNYTPIGFLDNTLFGIDPTLDSMKIVLQFQSTFGDTNQVFDVSVFEIKDTIFHSYHTYFSNFAPTNFIESEPVLKFELKGSAPVVIEHLPGSFFNRLMYNDPDPESNPYYSDSIFHSIFKGFCFSTSEVSPPNRGAMRRLDITKSSMTLYYHNKDEKPDTTTMAFIFRGTNNAVKSAVNFYSTQHDYTTADPAAGGVDYHQIGDSTVSTSKVYISGMSGLGARVEFDRSTVDSLLSKAKKSNYTSVALHQAYIRWHTIDQSAESYDNSFDRLGLYYNFATASIVPDYDPIRENNNNSFKSDIGGYLNRANGYYQQVVTSTVQRLFTDPSAKFVVQLLPSFLENYLYAESYLGGSASPTHAPEMVLVYTLVK